MSLQCFRADADGVTTISFKGKLTVMTIATLEDMTNQLVLERVPHVVVDLSGLDAIDDSGVRVLVALRKGVAGAGGRIEMDHARDQVLAVLKLLRMDEALRTSPRGDS